MKIALLTPGGVDRSGVNRVIPCLLWLIERLVAAGDEVHVFTQFQEPTPGRWPLLGATVHNAARRMRSGGMLWQILAEHRRGRFDVLHALWTVPQGVVAAMVGRLLAVPVLLHLPGGDLARLPDIGYGGRLSPAGRLWSRVAALGADRIVAPSNFIVGQARALGLHAERIPFGVALDHWPPSPPRRRRATDPARLVHVGSLNLVKDQGMLLGTAAALRDRGVAFELDIIGEDTLGGMLQRRATALGLDGLVRFHGFIPQDELRPWIERADLLLVTSRHEAGPIVALEAAAVGVPTVGTAVGHLSDWAPEAAAVVATGDSDGLSQKIIDLLENENERLTLAARAQAIAVRENADQTTIRFRTVYRKLADG